METISKLPSTSLKVDKIRQQIVGLGQATPLLNGQERPYIFFDNAASTPVFQEVLDTINQFMPWYSSVHRGGGFKSKVATQAYDDARQAVSDFFGANVNDHVVIFGKNTTEAINKLSYRLQLSQKDVVLISHMEHHSNDLPWRQQTGEVYRIGVDNNGALIEDELDTLLQRHAGRVKLVAISGASNVTGLMPDIYQIARKVHAAGAQIFVDCAQLAPHRQIDIKPLSDPSHLDYIAVSAHKMYAPFGVGALVGRRDTFESGAPELCGGGTIKVVTTDKVEWADLPERDEAGSPNVVGALAFAKALQVLDTIGMDFIAGHEAELTAYALNRLNTIPGIKIYGNNGSASTTSRLGVIPFNVKDLPHDLTAAILSAEWGIGVRNGCFCAHPYVISLLKVPANEIDDFRRHMVQDDRRDIPGLVRVSFGIYNTNEEVDILAEALEHIANGGYEGSYQQDTKTGEYHAIGWQPKLPKFI